MTQSLFESNEIMVQGFEWCLNEPKSIGLANLVAKILCKKHNSNLSELDDAALEAFNVFREAINLQNNRGILKDPQKWKVPLGVDWNVRRFTIDGPRLERWFLKTLINLSFGKEWTIGPGSHPKGTPSKALVDIAFGTCGFEANGAGLYVAARRGERIDSMDRVNFTPMSEGKNLVAGRFNFRGYTFFLNLLPERFSKFDDSDLLYRETTFNCRVAGCLSHSIEFKGW